MALHHVNFHTARNKPVFEVKEYDRMLRACLTDVITDRQILCLAWELMPTHAHIIIQDFDDFPRGTIVKYIKGDTSRAFFRTYPDLRADLLGGHLWADGYSATRITSHRQYLAALEYVRTNRQRAELPPVLLEPSGTP